MRIDPVRYRVIRAARRRATTVGATPLRALRGKRRARRARRGRRPAAPPPMALQPPRPVGWGGGEAMTYRIRLLGIEIARAALSVGRPKGRQLRLRGRGETVPLIKLIAPISEELTTRLDLDGLRPLRSTSRRLEADRRRRIDTVHHRWTADTKRRHALVDQFVTRSRGDQPLARKDPSKPARRPRRRLLAGPVVDSMTALQLLRSAELTEKRPLRLYVLDGTALFAVDLRLGGRERLQTALGPRDCIRIDGVGRRIHDDGRVAKGKRERRGSIWLSADEARVPVRLAGDTKFGFVTAAITSYRAARRPVVVRLPRVSRPAR